MSSIDSKIVIDPKIVEAVKKAIGGDRKDDRRVFENLADGIAAFERAVKAAPEGFPTYAHGADSFYKPQLNDAGEVVKDEDGNVMLSDELIPGINVAVAVVGARKRDSENKVQSGIKAIVLWPMPSLATFLEHDEGEGWIWKVIEKEAAHVAFRGLRNAETLDEFEAEFNAMPKDVASIITSQGSVGVDTDAFDSIWPEFRSHLKDAMPKLVAHLPSKQEVIRAIRSKPFAEQEYPKLEQINAFTYIGTKMCEAGENLKDPESGEAAPVDMSSIRAWLDGRNDLDLSRPKPDEADLDSLNLGF